MRTDGEICSAETRSAAPNQGGRADGGGAVGESDTAGGPNRGNGRRHDDSDRHWLAVECRGWRRADDLGVALSRTDDLDCSQVVSGAARKVGVAAIRGSDRVAAPKSAGVLNVACPPESVTPPGVRSVPPSWKSTVPVNPPPRAFTVAVNVTACPSADGLGEEAKLVVVSFFWTHGSIP